MSNSIPWGTAANAQQSVTTVINLKDYLIEKQELDLINADKWTVSVKDNDMMMFDNGNIPTTTLGEPLTAGQSYQVTAPPDKINYVSVTGTAKITFSGEKSTPYN